MFNSIVKFFCLNKKTSYIEIKFYVKMPQKQLIIYIKLKLHLNCAQIKALNFIYQEIKNDETNKYRHSIDFIFYSRSLYSG